MIKFKSSKVFIFVTVFQAVTLLSLPSVSVVTLSGRLSAFLEQFPYIVS